jgi:hypothetical protein
VRLRTFAVILLCLGASACGTGVATSGRGATGASTITSAGTGTTGVSPSTAGGSGSSGVTTTSNPYTYPIPGTRIDGTQLFIPRYGGQGLGGGCDAQTEGNQNLTVVSGYLVKCPDVNPTGFYGSCLPSHVALRVSTGASTSFTSGASVPLDAQATNTGSTTCTTDTAKVTFLIVDPETGALVWDSIGALNSALGSFGKNLVDISPGAAVGAPPPNSWDQHTCNDAEGCTATAPLVAPGTYQLEVDWGGVGLAGATFEIG